MEEKVKYRIGWLGGSLMLAMAAVADLVQIVFTFLVALAPASDIVTVITEGCLAFYYFVRGVHFLKGKGSTGRVVGFLITTVIEMVPFLDALPTLTFDTWYNIHSSRKADREEFKERQEQLATEAAQQSAQEEAQYSRWAYQEAYAQGMAERQAEEQELEDA